MGDRPGIPHIARGRKAIVDGVVQAGVRTLVAISEGVSDGVHVQRYGCRALAGDPCVRRSCVDLMTIYRDRRRVR